MTRRAIGIVEGSVIALGIISLWPYILGYRALWYLMALPVVLGLLAVVAAARMRRFRRAIEKQLHKNPGPPRPPGPQPPRDGGHRLPNT